MIRQIREGWRDRAREMSRLTFESLRKKGKLLIPNYTGIHAPRRFEIGYLGEIVFDDVLRFWGCSYRWDPKTDGRSHGPDFILLMKTGELLPVEVKTTPRLTNRYIMIPAAQGQDVPPGRYFVGIREEGDVAEICGFMEFRHFERVFQPTKGGATYDTFRFPLERCKNITELIQATALK